jgi:hypothetical protein
MTLTVQLDESAGGRLRARALAEGTPVEEFAAKLLSTDSEANTSVALESMLDEDYHAECELDTSIDASLNEVRTALEKISGSLTVDFSAERDER